MKVKIFDEAHELDLEKAVNEFLSDLEGELIDIKYQVAVSIFSEEQIYCFSAFFGNFASRIKGKVFEQLN